MSNRLIVAGLVALGACGFSKELPPDAPGPTITIGFEAGMSSADEKSSAHHIKVKLSEASTKDVTVKYQIEGGTATPLADFDIVTPETMTIPAGQLEFMLEVKVKADTDGTEVDETIDLILIDPVGAQISIGAERHEVLIRAHALPRVSFMAPASMDQEPTDVTFDAVLDEPSEFEIMATYTVTSTNATSGMDYVLADGVVTFPIGTTSVPLTLDVLDDSLDEDNESVDIKLVTATNSEVDTTKDTHTHTILDDLVDPPPDVFFNAASTTVGEAVGTTTIQIRLSAASGRTVTVPFTTSATSSATATADYAITTTSPIAIPAGTTTTDISVTVVNDTADEPNETLVVDLGAATNATNNTGAQQHTLNVTDDDQICYGPLPFAVCLDSPPAGALTLPASINTNAGGSALCAGTQPTGWTTAPQSQPAACFILRDTITVTGTVTVTGNRPLVLLGATSITVNGTIDAGSSNTAGTTGAASPSGDCGGFGQNPNGNSNGGGGGAGGTFMTVGGNGGTGDGGSNVQAGTAAMAATAPVPKLRAGCNGQRGGNGGGGNASGQAGRGGGAVYLVTGGTLTLAATAIVNVSGGAARGGNNSTGGSGGGSGGMIKLFSQTLTATAGAILVSNGGGGSSGGDGGANGTDGNDVDPATPATAAAGGTGGGGANGGDGYASGTAATNGSNGNNNQGGGGGGGGGGYIQSNNALTNVTASAGVIAVP